MKNKTLMLCLPFVSLGLMLSLSLEAAHFKRGDRIELRGEYSDNLFAAGGDISADLKSTDDIYLAGGKIRFRGSTREDLAVAGGEVSIADAKIQELVVAGGSVRIERAEISDDAVTAGGEVFFGPDTTVRGSANIAGGEVTLSGNFAGDVEVSAGRLRIEPTAVISGNLGHRTRDLEIAPGARILGQTIARTPDVAPSGGVFALLTIGSLLFFLGTFLVAPVWATLFPGAATYGADRIRAYFWEMLGKGFASVVFAPVVLAILMISVVGTPLALTLVPLFIAGAVLAWSIAVHALGVSMHARLRRGSEAAEFTGKRRFGWTMLASLVMALALMVPVAGAVFAMLGFFVGVGALYELMRARFARKPPAPETRAETEAAA